MYSIDLTPLVAVWLAAQASAPAPAAPAEVRERVNAERSARGAPDLRIDSALERAARARAAEVANAGDLAGQEVSGDALGSHVAAFGYDQRLIGEIVLSGVEDFGERFEALRDADPDAFADAMRPEYRDIGVGIARGDNGVVVALYFGLPQQEEFARRTRALSDLSATRRDLLARVNAARAERRLPPLRENALLDRAAQGHASDMIRRSYYGHESPDGTGAMERARAEGYPAAAIGENIAENQSSAAEVMDAWMKSPGHREHILSVTLQEIGLGMAFGKNARGYEIVWVQVFGTPGAAGPALPRKPSP